MRDLTPGCDVFLRDVLDGLSRAPRSLPCKYFYDEEGSRLFERICGLDEYYLTRTELEIMRRHAPEMARRVGPGCLLVEYGSGSGLKTRLLLDRLARPAGYVPVDISPQSLQTAAAALADRYPDLSVRPVCADFTRPFRLPECRLDFGPHERRQADVRRTVVYFPGSTIGNFGPHEAVALLRNMRELAGPSGAVLIGVDLPKRPEVLEAAYDDAQGVTAAFNLNLLARINRELGADFRLDGFRHCAFFNEAESRIEMHLVSRTAQTVHVGGAAFAFVEGDAIHTESSYKYGVDRFRELAAAAGLRVEEVWLDPRGWFSVQFLTG